MANDFSDIQMTGTVIAELPSGDLNSFSFNQEAIPVLPLADDVAFPEMPQPIKINDENELRMVEEVYENKDCLLAIPLKDPSLDGTHLKDYFPAGVVCKVAKIIKMPNMPTMVFLIGGPRVRLKKIVNDSPIVAQIAMMRQLGMQDNPEMNYLLDGVKESFNQVFQYASEQDKARLNFNIEDIDHDPVRGVFFTIIYSPLSLAEKASLLASSSFAVLLEEYLKLLDISLQKLEIRANIHMRTHEDMNEQQKRMFLQQQLKTIREELDGNDEDSDIGSLKEKAKKISWSKEARAHFDKELRKLERYNTANPEYSIQYSYLENLLNLPWDNYSREDFALSKVEKILNRDHYGLDQVKERIIEQMAVIKLRKDMKAPIICLYGPPGVGKTSLGRSIASALGREYARVSLGGLHDEAEIRGHRRTYIGAMPGRIISALAKCGSGNPVFVLDEIDKIGRDFKGDPSTALLEVLDPEQNSKFHDNYLDFDYDLSKILFIATANSLSEISRPLLDRMEIIEIGGYIIEEKIEIARRHLVPKSLEEHGFGKDELSFSNEALGYIVSRYTRESGVRQLEKKIAKVLRKIARLKASRQAFPKVIDSDKVKELLGKEEVNPDSYETNRYAGVVTGLAWTQVGGEILFIETSLSPGNGEKLTLTGNLGDVMKESAVIALQYLKAHAKKLGIDPEVFSKANVHLHVPEGAIPKDGPSAGVTMATSLASAFTGRKVRDKIAMTGEITLRGKVLPVGGIKEKILAAKRAGITDIILSRDNQKDIEEINARYLKGLEFHYVETVEDVLNLALLPELADIRFEI